MNYVRAKICIFELTIIQIRKDMQFKYFKMVEFFTFLRGSWLSCGSCFCCLYSTNNTMQAAKTKIFQKCQEIKICKHRSDQ
jgi:hypothetical protein